MNFLTVAAFEIKRSLRMPYFFVFQILFPILLIFILGSALKDVFQMKDMEFRPVQVAWVQQDKGTLRAVTEQFLQSSAFKRVVAIRPVTSREAAINAVKSGDAEFAAIVPEDFSDKVLQGKAASWEWIPGKNRGQNLVAQSALQSFLDETNGMQAISMSLGAEVRDFSGGEAAKSYVQQGKLSYKYPYSAKQYYAASMLVMFLLYAGMSAALSLMGEKESHTLSRLNATPVTEVSLLLGKLFGLSLLAAVQSVFIVGFTHYALDVNWGVSYGVIAAVCVSLIVVSKSFAVIGMAITKGSKSLMLLFQLPIMAMTFLSGGFTPLTNEGILGKIRELTINHWAFQSLLNNMLGSDSSLVWHQTMVLAAIAGVLLAGSIVVYRKAGYHE